MRNLVQRQPSLLARASESLQTKVTAYAEIFGEDVGQVSSINRQERGHSCQGHCSGYMCMEAVSSPGQHC